MKILYINHYAGSVYHGMEYRPYYMSRQWVSQGYEVTIVASSEAHVRQSRPTMHNDITEENIDGIRYLWCRTPPYQGNGIRRVFNILSFVRHLFSAALRSKLNDKLDVVIASSTYPLDIYPARKIAKRFGAKLVFEVHDLWPLSPIELGGMSRKHPFIVLLQHAENYACRHADAVVSMLPKADQYLVEHGMAQERFCYVPNGVIPDEWDENQTLPKRHATQLNQLRTTGHFLVGYAGAHGVANALDSILDAAYILQDVPVTFVLVGQGPEKARLMEKAKLLKLKNVLFLGSVSRSYIPTLLKCFDALFIGLQNEPLFYFGISPNKLIDYMMAAKPIIMAINAGNDLVAEARCGISILPEDSKALAAAVLDLAALRVAERLAMGNRGRVFVKMNHSYQILAERFLNFIFK